MHQLKAKSALVSSIHFYKHVQANSNKSSSSGQPSVGKKNLGKCNHCPGYHVSQKQKRSSTVQFSSL